MVDQTETGVATGERALWCAWASLLALAVLNGIGLTLPGPFTMLDFARYSVEALLLYLTAGVIVTACSGEGHWSRGWLLIPIALGAVAGPFVRDCQPWVAWFVRWGSAGILAFVFLREVGVRRRGEAGLAITLGGTADWQLAQAPTSNRDSTCWLFAVATLLAVLALRLDNRSRWAAALRNVRWERVLHYSGLLALGIYMSAPKTLTVPVVIAAVFSICLAWAAAVSNNDLVDREIDSVSNTDRPLVVNLWTPRAFAVLGVCQTTLAVLGAVCVSETFAGCIAAYLAIAFVYSTPPLRLKKYLVVSTGLIALASLFAVAAGFVSSGERSLSQFPLPVAIFFLVAFTSGVNFKDIKDYEGDRRDGIRTVVTWLGLRWGKLATAGCVSVGFLSAPVIFGRASLWWPSVACALMASFVVTRFRFREKFVFLTYYVYFLILLASGIFRGEF